MDRTNIIDNDEVARAMALASPGKRKGKGKQKATQAYASCPAKTKKTSTVPTARERTQATASATPATAATPTQALEARFYEANGLKIPLYNKDGLGNKKRQYARLSKGLLKYSLEDLLDIVEQYAGAGKRKELKDKGLQKSRLANWIEEKETLALGRNPKSALSIADNEEEEAEPGDDTAAFLASPTPKYSGTKDKKPNKTASTSNKKTVASLTPTKDTGTFDQPSHTKRSAPDRAPDGQPHAKLQKRDAPINSVATNTGPSAKDSSIDKSTTDVVPTPSQTKMQTTVYNDKNSELHRQDKFMKSTGMNPFDPDRSSMIIRGDGGDHILTATPGQGFREGEIYLHETTISHGANEFSDASFVPYLKKGEHGRKGDFLADDCRRTGEGHQIEPDDQLKWGEFKTFHGRLYKRFPHYPKPNKGISIDPEVKNAWDVWRIWYGGFTKKSPGYAFAHLWPCGCEKVRDEDESEEE